MKENINGWGLKIWQDYPELKKAVLSCKLPNHLVLTSKNWGRTDFLSLLNQLSYVPIKTLVFLNISKELLAETTEAVRLSGVNRVIKLDGDYDKGLDYLKQTTKLNSGQTVIISDREETKLVRVFSDSDLIIQNGEELIFPSVAKAIVDFSNS